MTMQNGSDRTRSGTLSMQELLQWSPQFSPTPRGVLVTEFDNQLFHLIAAAARRVYRASRSVFQAGETLALVTVQPLVTSGGANAKATTQSSYIGTFGTGQEHEFSSQRHDKTCFPGHLCFPSVKKHTLLFGISDARHVEL